MWHPTPSAFLHTQKHIKRTLKICQRLKTVSISLVFAALIWSLMYTRYDAAVSIFYRHSALVNSQDGQSLPNEKLYYISFVLIYGTQINWGLCKENQFSYIPRIFIIAVILLHNHKLSVCKAKRLLLGFSHLVLKT